MKGGEYTVFNWSDVDSPSVEVRRTIQTLTMEVSQIMKVGWVGCMEGWAGWWEGQDHLAVRVQGPGLAHGCRATASAAAGLACWPPPSLLTPCCRSRAAPPPPAGRLHALHGEGDL